MIRKMYRASIVTAAALAFATQAMASGFGIFTQSATALGQANSVSAHHDEPSALFFNPALMGKMSGTQIELGTTVLFPDREFTSNFTSSNTMAEHQIFYPSTMYATHSLTDEFSVGLAIFSPFGLGTNWPETWEGRYLATESELTTFNINPSVSWRLHERLTLGAGVDLILFDTSLERKINSAALGTFLGIPGAGSFADTNQKFKGDGQGWGYNLGLLFDITDAWTLGVGYRSRVTVDADGDLTFQLPTPFLGAVLPNTSAETEITLPDQLTAGLAWRTNEKLTIEAGIRWEGWNTYDQVQLTTALPVLGSNTITEQKNWEDTLGYTLGFDYQLTPQTRLLAGYLYGPDAVPDTTFEPAVPDSPSHLFTLGTKWQGKHWGFGGSYAYQLQEDRSKNNLLSDPLTLSPATTANGEYATAIHLVALSAIYRF